VSLIDDDVQHSHEPGVLEDDEGESPEDVFSDLLVLFGFAGFLILVLVVCVPLLAVLL
jgi:hypothetical protein